jgi:hypothetical protein
LTLAVMCRRLRFPFHFMSSQAITMFERSF